MKPLTCPQCGGKITEYLPFQQFAACEYCETGFVIEWESQKPVFVSQPIYEPVKTSNPNIFFTVIAASILIIFGIFFIAILANKKEKEIKYPVYKPPVYPASTPLKTPTPTPDPNILVFGGKGTGNGLFEDADSIAVDKHGRIYVADETLRVQQFDETGKFLKLWQVPPETAYYKRARSIEKIAVDDKDRLYVLVAGIVLIYQEESSRPLKLVHFAPNPIQDFALRADGGRLFLINGENAEYSVEVSSTGKTVRRLDGFHTKAADAALSPYETGLAAIRFALDGAGNIFSVYAFGDLGSYQLSYDADDLMIFRFTPEGKYVNKFVHSMNSCGIEVDNQSRIYVSDENAINVYSNRGEALGAVSGLNGVDAFALDDRNNIYILNDETVIKRSAIDTAVK